MHIPDLAGSMEQKLASERNVLPSVVANDKSIALLICEIRDFTCFMNLSLQKIVLHSGG